MPGSPIGAGRPIGASRTIGFAHRGARSEYPDNTLAGFARALVLGATGLESDVWVTADGVAVLDHDGEVHQRGRWRWPVSVGPIGRGAPIARVGRAALPAHIPSLDDLYRSSGSDYELSLDVKDHHALPAVLAAADAVGARDRLWLCHPDRSVLAGWRPVVGAARLVLSTRARTLPPEGPARPRWLDETAAGGIDCLNLHRSEWTSSLVAEVHRAGLAGFGWDAQAARDVARLVDLGLDGIYSDHVDVLMAAIARG